MEKHRCKLCFRRFANGRALGGHMRSHAMNFRAEESKRKVNPFENHHQQIDHQVDDFQLSSAPSSSSSSSSDGEDEEREEKGIQCYGFMRKKKQRFCVVQDRESETDSSKNNKLKRVRKLRTSGIKSKKSDSSEMVEPEPLSSISDTTPEESVAYCLMMLSRDKWKRKESQDEDEEEEDSGVAYRRRNLIGLLERDEPNKVVLKTKARGKYRCETCNKVFRSYQALGGHRASHKKFKVELPPPELALKIRNKANAGGGSTVAAAAEVEVEEEKVHECPVCYRVFPSGQALGGHKRSHFIGAGAISSIKPFSRCGETLNIDLNLPAPIDDDAEISHAEISAVSDAEFVNPNKLS